MYSRPQIIKGVFAFEGRGLEAPFLLHPSLAYVAPADKRVQTVYFRAGNSTPEMIYILLMRDGAPMRLFPIGAKASEHVPLAVIEDLFPETRLELFIGAPEGLSGHAVVDLGLVEI